MRKTMVRGMAVLALAGIARPALALEISAAQVGPATVKFNGLLQGWTVSNDVAAPTNDGYRLRRAEMKVSGVIADAPRYFLMIDPAKLIKPAGSTKDIPASAMIQDFGMSYAVVPGFELTAGQFKTPSTAEGLDSSGDLLLPERSLMGRTFGDKREIGARLAYKTADWNVASMLSSARHLSVDGDLRIHDLVSRAELTPVKDLSLGTFLVLGDFEYKAKGRWGANARYRWGQAVFRAEYGQGRDSGVQSRGMNLETGYFITENLEPVFRYETFSPNQTFSVPAKAETLGVNYILPGRNAKVQVAGSALQNMTGGNGTPVVSKGKNDRVLTVALQAQI